VRYDVAIVGAGPSGAWTATLLARRGARVLLIDPSHPREKPCGGGITGRALAIVGDPIPSGRLPSVRIRAARFVDSRAKREADVLLPGNATALLVSSRTDFDGALLQGACRAGVDLLESRVSDVRRDGAAFELIMSSGARLTTAFVVGADGANSLVRRKLCAPFRRSQLSIATGYFAHGVTSDRIVIEMFADPPGYIWSFPRPDHLAIGICAQADARVGVDRLREMVRRWMQSTGIASGARLEPYAWPIPSLSSNDFLSLDLAGPGWLTVGDAAGLVDPITREGIFFALQSAVAAADALASTSADRVQQYTARVRAEISADLARAARYKAGFFQPRFTRLLVDALQSSEKIRGVMADLVAGTQSYRGLKRRLARTMEFGLAWRLLTSQSG
jgi:geranylgeranyl diphosphate/geranylgeranyl-bacteriochlorophyllide a reductase